MEVQVVVIPPLGIKGYIRKEQHAMATETILTASTAQRKLRRLALEIAEDNSEAPEIIFVGIREHGLIIARTVARYLGEVYTGVIHVMPLQMDKRNPITARLEEGPALKNQVVVLVDDVANSGRTLLHALQPLISGHPFQIKTLALVERTHKSFPVQIDYVGLSVSTTLNQHITVEVEGMEVLGASMEVVMA